MLFNSYEFILVFLPVTLALFFASGRFDRSMAALWLFAASLFFYGWWNPVYVALLLASIIFNFSAGTAIAVAHRNGRHVRKRWLLTASISVNLALLAYFKYANFFVANANALLDSQLSLGQVVLPLGISFFTFTQIAFLVDASRGEVREGNFVHYGLFVTYFPHLIAGPVLHHKEMMPQFGLIQTYRPSWENIAVGLTVFIIGLFKKVVLADGVAPFATPVFNAASAGTTLTLLEAWCGALAYTLQLYFDFSGYSDMAIGLSRLFGIRLPLNFDSPYKATSIIDFWRRWHMTLSRFLRDYLYIPLGGNRFGNGRRYANLLTTMMLGGLWHGAGWTFVIWGALHGLYLCVNHLWQRIRHGLFGAAPASAPERLAGFILTFLAVVVGWVFFRASDLASATAILHAMTGSNGILVPYNWPAAWQLHSVLEVLGIPHGVGSAASQFDPAGSSPYWIAALLVIAWALPNTQQFMDRFTPALEPAQALPWRPRWNPGLAWAVPLGALAAVAFLHLTQVSEFLYFQF